MKSFLFQLRLSLALAIGSCLCKPLGNNIHAEAPLDGMPPDLLDEEEIESRMENLLESLKEGFLRQLNLSEVPQENFKVSPPQFMVELYKKYSSDRLAAPQSDVIRSFTVQEIPVSETNNSRSKHRLQFGVSIPGHEKITTAELQLLFLPDGRSKVASQSPKTTVKVYQADAGASSSQTPLLLGKEAVGWKSSWVTFDVTTAVQRWARSGRGAAAFDVVVERRDCGASPGTASCLNMSLSVGDNSSAALIVFSDDLGNRRRKKNEELREMILHEEETLLHSGADWYRGNQIPNEVPGAQPPRRPKRKAEREYCRRSSLKVNFKDIGWDSWIVAPPEYDAFECRGQCYYPLTDESTPSKHALIQTLMNIRDPRKASMACCVPIKLDPITVMYQENGRLTIRYLYEEMKVAECGCR
ncbi:growth/differentiation factor 2 [Oryzias melastigma]|uniref:Growth differentiation factor 2 n=1 Tax=Oryzias melastigma TaxID=30732 RepID=A0A3B3DC23_ORYME|nr:growth/differentiation factor 2 [Oryzias melastigma]